jgi:hypothetical protein
LCLISNKVKFLRWGVVSWRTTPCRLSATAYSKYSHLPSTSGGPSSTRNLRTRHAAVTRTHLSLWQGPTYHLHPAKKTTFT